MTQILKNYLKTLDTEMLDEEIISLVGAEDDELIGDLVGCIGQWHIERNLIDGSTDLIQFKKLFEEFIELYATLLKAKGEDASPNLVYLNLLGILTGLHAEGRIKEPTSTDISDDVGDISVVLINLLLRNNISYADALGKAWDDIKDRKGKMINGVFVKESDLL